MKTSPARNVRRPANPWSSETVLVAVTGMSPAILTETAWALAREAHPVIPRKVVAFCTTRSRDQVRRELFASGVWESLRAALRVGPHELVFGDTGDHIRVFTRGARELDDIRTPADNTAAADFILEHLRQFTENPDVRLVASIAGGRKTMSALLYAGMTLIGRETDRLTHVLVGEPFDTLPRPARFFFPLQPEQRLTGPTGRTVRAHDARIDLADVPFVPLRNKFVEIGRMPGNFSSLVRHYARELKADSPRPARVKLDDASMTVSVNGVCVTLGYRAYIVLRFAMRLAETDSVPVGLNVTDEALRAFILETGINNEWAKSAAADPDLKRELSALRKAFDAAGIDWKPGERRNALRLPLFKLVAHRSA